MKKSIADLQLQLSQIRPAVAGVKNSKQVYTAAFGLKNQATGQSLQTTDLFRIASISKSFVATGVMQLVEKKKLRLDDDVSKLLGFEIRNPTFPHAIITLKMLLSHRSSLNDSRG
ncbi:MAG: serine hydrolase [Rhizobacter sp.]|nr:serine hydrolase [Ferruginibacter sp.]